MKSNVLLAESGGSKTDWIYFDREGKTTSSTTKSLHPGVWKEMNWNELLPIWKKMHVDLSNTAVHFFGAGCNGKENSNALKEILSSFGFSHVIVSGDLSAAGLSTLGATNGYVAILGSGSVLIDFRAEKVQNYYGGLGRKFGDEGAGFYFGKMILEAFTAGDLSTKQKTIVESCLTEEERMDVESKQFTDELCLQMAAKLSANQLEFKDYHTANFQLFFDKYVQQNVPLGSVIHFVGSYAHYHATFLEEVCLENAYKLGKLISRPIQELANYYKNLD